MATYQTQQGDTWDLISFRAYGTEFHTDELFKANLKYSDIAVFSAGYIIEIPEIIAAAPVSVAPWERETVAETASETAPVFSFSRDRGPSYRILERYVAIMTKNARLHFKEGV
jgi:phage tail protein X